jgi:hypothetical protein
VRVSGSVKRCLGAVILACGAVAGSAQAVGAPSLETVPAVSRAGIHVTGGLPDGTVAPGSSLEIVVSPGAVTGVPTPTVSIAWLKRETSAGSDVIAGSRLPYGGPLLMAPTSRAEERRFDAEVTARNSVGSTTVVVDGVSVRSAPILSYGCLCLHRPSPTSRLRVRVGSRLSIEQMVSGADLGPPPVVGGVPAPRIARHWLRCRRGRCASIPRATGASYVPTPGDVHQTIRLRLTAVNPVGSYRLTLVTPGRLAVVSR